MGELRTLHCFTKREQTLIGLWDNGEIVDPGLLKQLDIELGGETLRLTQRLFDHMSFFDACETLIQPVVEIAESAVVEAHQSQDCGVKVRYVRSIFDSFETEFIGCSDRLAAFYAAASQPH